MAPGFGSIQGKVPMATVIRFARKPPAPLTRFVSKTEHTLQDLRVPSITQYSSFSKLYRLKSSRIKTDRL